jgi:hypothetical protein
MVASFMSSADAQRLLQLRMQLERLTMSKQQLERIEDFQQAALMNVIDNVATLEKQNLQLKQSLLMSLRTLDAKTDGKALKMVKGQMGLFSQKSADECSRWSKSKAPDILKSRAPAEPHPEPCPATPALPYLMSCDSVQNGVQLPVGFRAWQTLPQQSSQSSDHDEETEHAESSPNGSSCHALWPENATTVLIHNMPPRSTIDELIKAFPPDGSYDLINLPFNVKARRTSSFATINFISVDLAAAFFQRFEGQRLPHSTRSCKNPLSITAARIQGLEANLVKLRGEKGIAEMRNAALLPRLYLTGAVAERLASKGPKSVKQPDEHGQPRRLDFREVLSSLDDAEI